MSRDWLLERALARREAEAAERVEELLREPDEEPLPVQMPRVQKPKEPRVRRVHTTVERSSLPTGATCSHDSRCRRSACRA